MTDLSNINKATLARNQAAFDAAGIDISASLPMDTTQPTKQDVRNEKELQRLCEAELTRRDYLRLTAANVEHGSYRTISNADWIPPRGWYAHWPNNKRNPLMPDLEIYAYPNRKPALLIELKRANRWQPGQREMIRLGFWRECWEFDTFVRLLDEWER